MEELYYRIILGILIIAFFVVRAPSVGKASKTEKVKEKKSGRERVLVFLNFVGMVGIPLIYILTPWLDYFAYPYPEIFRIFGIAFYISGLILLACVHRTLGKHFSMMLKLEKEHNLVMSGPYSRVRHPMYSAFYIMVISTALICANLFVGIFGIAAWTLLYIIRIDDEESMLVEQFGDEYSEYMMRTGRLLPKLKK